jgi:hypothetical protein
MIRYLWLMTSLQIPIYSKIYINRPIIHTSYGTLLVI